VPLVPALFRQHHGAFEVAAGFVQLAAEQTKLAERIEAHRDLLVSIIYFDDQRKRAIERLVRAIPLADEHQLSPRLLWATAAIM
jgi:hypothetical protein